MTSTANQFTVGGIPLPAGRLYIGTNATSTGGAGHALNSGPSTANPNSRYLLASQITNPLMTPQVSRAWGPSSDHSGGIVNHLFGDGHVDGIPDGIEPNLYLWIVSRAGGEATGGTN